MGAETWGGQITHEPKEGSWMMELKKRKNGKRLVLSEASYQKVTQILKELNKKSRSRLCVFADMNGYPITYSGSTRGIDVSSLAALSAGDFSATAEMAKILSGDKNFHFIYHEGSKENVYLCNVGDDYLLIVVFSKKVALGMIRLMSHHATEQLLKLIDSIREQSSKASEFLDMEFRDLLTKELDKSLKIK